MRQITIYSFSELEEEAQKVAIDEYRCSELRGDNFYTEQEINNCYIEIAEKVFNPLAELYNDIEKDIDYRGHELKGIRLYTWIQNNLSYLWTSPAYYTYSNVTNDIIKRDYKAPTDKITKKSNIKTKNNIDNCPITGICWDYTFLSNIIEFLKNPTEDTTLQMLLEDRTQLQDVLDNESENYNSDEYIIEELNNIDDVEFFSNGEVYIN
jgi:hypothetical protein